MGIYVSMWDILNYMCVHEGLVFLGEWNERETIFWTHQDFILTQRGLFALTPNLLEPKGKRERERERERERCTQEQGCEENDKKRKRILEGIEYGR